MEKNLSASAGDIRNVGSVIESGSHALEEGMATHSSILAWEIPWTEESMGSQRVGHNVATKQQVS